MSRIAYIRRRLVLAVFVLFGVTVVIFGMVHFLPGDPAAMLLGDRGTAQNIAQLHDQLGLNQPLPQQYWLFVSGLVQGNMGDSLVYHQPVRDMVLSRVPISVGLAVYAMVLAGIFTLTFGLLAAVNKGGWIDQVIRVVFLFALTTPGFWFGILLILVFALALHWFPVAGLGSSPVEHVWYLFLPALALSLQLSAVLIRNLRSQVITTMSSDYVRTARAKGLAESTVMFRHVLKNAMIPILTGVVVVIPSLFLGSLISESFFGIPGLGSYTIDAIQAQDFAIVRAMVFLGSVLYIAGLLLTDLSYTLVDPRIRFE
jgi:peptide/nickel transport system permease protein